MRNFFASVVIGIGLFGNCSSMIDQGVPRTPQKRSVYQLFSNQNKGLFDAIYNGDKDQINDALRAGVDLNASIEFINAEHMNGYLGMNAFHLLFYRAAQSKHNPIEILEALIDHGDYEDALNARIGRSENTLYRGLTPLFVLLGAHSGREGYPNNTQASRFLNHFLNMIPRELKAIVLETPCRHSVIGEVVYPIHYAIWHKLVHESTIIIDSMLKEGFDIDQKIESRLYSRFEGFTPLHLAAHEDFLYGFNYLINKGADYRASVNNNEFDFNGFEVIHLALYNGQKSHGVVERICELDEKCWEFEVGEANSKYAGYPAYALGATSDDNYSAMLNLTNFFKDRGVDLDPNIVFNNNGTWISVLDVAKHHRSWKIISDIFEIDTIDNDELTSPTINNTTVGRDRGEVVKDSSSARTRPYRSYHYEPVSSSEEDIVDVGSTRNSDDAQITPSYAYDRSKSSDSHGSSSDSHDDYIPDFYEDISSKKSALKRTVAEEDSIQDVPDLDISNAFGHSRNGINDYLDHAIADINAAKQEADKNAQDLANLTRIHADFCNEIDYLNKKIKSFNDQEFETQAQFDAQATLVAEAEQRLEQVHQEKADYAFKIKELEKRVFDLDKELGLQRGLSDDLERQMQEKDDAKEVLEETIKRLEVNLFDLEDLRQELENELTQQDEFGQKALDDAQAEWINQSREDEQKWQKTTQDLYAKIADLTNDIEEHIEKITRLEEINDNFYGDIDALKADLEALGLNYDALKNERDQLITIIDDLRGDLNDETAGRADLEKKVSGFNFADESTDDEDAYVTIYDNGKVIVNRDNASTGKTLYVNSDVPSYATRPYEGSTIFKRVTV